MGGLLLILARFTYGSWVLEMGEREREREWDKNRHWIWGPMISSKRDLNKNHTYWVRMASYVNYVIYVSFRVALLLGPAPSPFALSVMQMILVRIIILRSYRTDGLSLFFFFIYIYFPLLISWIYFSIDILSLIGPMGMKSVAWLFIVLTSLHFDSLIMNPNLKHSFAPCYFYGLKELVRSLWQYFKRQYF